jgi:uracil-DNA glycosylase
MEGRRRVLGEANGALRVRAVLVGTAPGRHGAERTGVPFGGDRSGAALDVLLGRVGLTRDEVFVTNAVLCNPQDGRGRNDEPTAAELRTCRAHLRATLELVEAPLIVALGRTAFAAVHATAPCGLRWEDTLGSVQPWSNGRVIAATYHPGPRVWMQPLRRATLEKQWDAVFQPETVKLQVRS